MREVICTVDGTVNIKTGNCRCVQIWVWRQTQPAHSVTLKPAFTEEESQQLLILHKDILSTNLRPHFVGDRQALTPPDASKQGKFHSVIFMTCQNELLTVYVFVFLKSLHFVKNIICSIINGKKN